MANIIRRTVKKGRDHVMGSVLIAINELSVKLDSQQNKIDAVEKNLQRSLDENKFHNNLLSDQIRNNMILPTADNEILVKIFNGLKIYLDTRDIAVAPHLALDGIWEPYITKAWSSLIKPNDVVFDIGANFGYYGLLAAQKTDKKNSKVVFFEANPHLIPYIQKTLSLNWYNEQSLVECFAVSDVAGFANLNILKGYIGSSGLQTVEELRVNTQKKMRLEIDEIVKVKSIPIDKYCEENNIKAIDLMKMDIEGHEEKAYAGMRRMVHSSPNLTLFIEFTKEAYTDPRKFYNSMLEDFSNVYLIDDNGALKKPKDSSYDAIIAGSDDWVMPVFSKSSKLASQH